MLLSKFIKLLVILVLTTTLFLTQRNTEVSAYCSGSFTCGIRQYSCDPTIPGCRNLATGACNSSDPRCLVAGECKQVPHGNCVANPAGSTNCVAQGGLCTGGYYCSGPQNVNCFWVNPNPPTDDPDNPPQPTPPTGPGDPPPPTPPPPIGKCSIGITPSSTTIKVGQVQELTANSSQVDKVSFDSSNTNIIRLNDNEDPYPGPYNTGAIAVNPGTARVRATGIRNGVAECSAEATITVTQDNACIVGKPSNLNFNCSYPGTLTTLTWTADPNATFYSVRVDNLADGWDGSCNSAAGDFCRDVTGTSISFNLDPRARYKWWIHSRNSCNLGMWGEAVFGPEIQCGPNCWDVTGDTSINVGQTGNFRANFESKDGDLRAELYRDSFNSLTGIRYFSSSPNYLTASWAPTNNDVGYHNIYCRAWNDAVAECRAAGQPDTDYDPQNEGIYACAGPRTSMQVAVNPRSPNLNTLLQSCNVGNHQVDLSWTSVGATNQYDYIIQRCTGATCSNFANIATVTTTAYTDTSSTLNENQTYRYRIIAEHKASGLRSTSNIMAVTLNPCSTYSCNITLGPLGNPQMSPGEIRSFVAQYTKTGPGTVSAVEIRNSNANALTPVLRRSSPPANPFGANFTATNNVGQSAKLQAFVIDSNNIEVCKSNEVNVEVVLKPWWQVVNGDVISGNTIQSNVFTGNFLFTGVGNSKGMPIYGTGIVPGYDSGRLSQTPPAVWNANTKTNLTTNYNILRSRVPSSVSWLDINNPSTNVSSLATSCASTDFCWFRRLQSGSENGSLDIINGGNLGNDRVIVFVNGDLNINGNITFNEGRGNAIFIARGNITIAPSVNRIDGVYISNARFRTVSANPDAQTLRINGIVYSSASPSLGRDRQSGNANPSEIFTFRPDVMFNFPRALMERNIIRWEEIPPDQDI